MLYEVITAQRVERLDHIGQIGARRHLHEGIAFLLDVGATRNNFV